MQLGLLSTSLALFAFLFIPGLSQILFLLFALLTGLSGGAGTILLFVWDRERKSLYETVPNIKARQYSKPME